jgi:hypothetical protein
MVENNILDELKYIVKNANLEFLNIDLIKTNVNLLYEIYIKIKNEYEQISKLTFSIETIKIEDINNHKNSLLYKKIINHLNIMNFSKNIKKNILNKIKSISKLKYNDLFLFWFTFDDTKDISGDNEIAINLFKIFISLNKFYKPTNNFDNRIVIWIPIDAQRDFDFDQINSSTLESSKKKYGAFVASGVTFNKNNFLSWENTNGKITNSKITIISRYEEIEKLLIHELIHNFNIDGSAYFDDLNHIISKYNTIKPSNNYNYPYSIFESYTELSSTYFYLIYKNINTNNNDIKNKIFGQILVEIIYSYNIISNLIKLNGYSTYQEFEKNRNFKGTICFYEYYYVKALLYNNFIYKLGYNLSDFVKIYDDINNIIKKNNKQDDKLMEEIYNCSNKNFTNFKYQIN